jgi:hypothetical protein
MIAYHVHGDVDRATAVGNQLTQLWDRSRLPSKQLLFQSGMQLLTDCDGEMTKEQFATWVACQMRDKTFKSTVRDVAQTTGFHLSDVPDFCTNNHNGWALKECFKVAAAGYFRLDVVSGAPVNWARVVLKGRQILAGQGLAFFRSNGPIETGQATLYHHGDCLIIAVNNACGGIYLSRDMMAKDDSRYIDGHISLKAIAGQVGKHTPFSLQLTRGMEQTFDVFTATEGVYVVALVLVRGDGVAFTHAIAVDRDRNVINFGLNDDGDEQIWRTAPPPRRTALPRRTAMSWRTAGGRDRGSVGSVGLAGSAEVPSIRSSLPHKLTSNLETILNHTAHHRVYSLY